MFIFNQAPSTIPSFFNDSSSNVSVHSLFLSVSRQTHPKDGHFPSLLFSQYFLFSFSQLFSLSLSLTPSLGMFAIFLHFSLANNFSPPFRTFSLPTPRAMLVIFPSRYPFLSLLLSTRCFLTLTLPSTQCWSFSFTSLYISFSLPFNTFSFLSLHFL